MMNASNYNAVETIRSGQIITIRAIRTEDAPLLRGVFHEVDKRSLYLRFFQNKSRITDEELEYFTEVDFINHVALVAVLVDDSRIIGGGRYFAYDSPTEIRSAEIAFMVHDLYQGLGIATLIMKHLLIIARENGIVQFEADVLPENAKMLSVFTRSGLPVKTSRTQGVVHVTLAL